MPLCCLSFFFFFFKEITGLISCWWRPTLHHQRLGGGRAGGGPRGPGGARIGGGPGGGWTTGGGVREGGVVRGPLDGGFVRGTELETRGRCSAAGGGGGGEWERGEWVGAWLFRVDSPSLTRWKLIQRPCQDTHTHTDRRRLNHNDAASFQRRIQIKMQCEINEPLRSAGQSGLCESVPSSADRGMCVWGPCRAHRAASVFCPHLHYNSCDACKDGHWQSYHTHTRFCSLQLSPFPPPLL